MEILYIIGCGCIVIILAFLLNLILRLGVLIFDFIVDLIDFIIALKNVGIKGIVKAFNQIPLKEITDKNEVE